MAHLPHATRPNPARPVHHARDGVERIPRLGVRARGTHPRCRVESRRQIPDRASTDLAESARRLRARVAAGRLARSSGDTGMNAAYDPERVEQIITEAVAR